MTMKDGYFNYFAHILNLGPEGVDLLAKFTDNMFPPRILDEFQQKGWEKLGNGYYLVPLPDLEPNRSQYSYLYKGSEQISGEIFRRGGIGGDWKGDYIELIMYTKIKPKRTGKPPKKTYDKQGNLIVVQEFSSGVHVIVNTDGEIVYTANGMCSYPYLQGGCLLSVDSLLINLKTGATILKYDGTALHSDKFLFIENKYNKEYPKGVYKIEFETGNFEIFEITK